MLGQPEIPGRQTSCATKSSATTSSAPGGGAKSSMPLMLEYGGGPDTSRAPPSGADLDGRRRGPTRCDRPGREANSDFVLWRQMLPDPRDVRYPHAAVTWRTSSGRRWAQTTYGLSQRPAARHIPVQVQTLRYLSGGTRNTSPAGGSWTPFLLGSPKVTRQRVPTEPR